MACFEFIISFKEALINIISNSYKGVINVHKDAVTINTDLKLLNPNIEIAIVCDINYGVPLYAQDGSIYTIDGKPVYVRTAKLINYEGK